MNQSHSAAVLHEAFSNYFGWETYWHIRPSTGQPLAIWGGVSHNGAPVVKPLITFRLLIGEREIPGGQIRGSTCGLG